MVNKDNLTKESTLIRVSLKTKYLLDNMGTKKDTYDTIINDLIKEVNV